MTDETCANCKHWARNMICGRLHVITGYHLAIDHHYAVNARTPAEFGCNLFEKKEQEQGPFYAVLNPCGATSYVFMRPGDRVVGVWEGGQKGNARAAVACDNLNELWAERNDE